MSDDEQNLQLLSIFHYIVAGIMALFACFPIIHLAIGLFIVFAPEQFGDQGNPPPAWFGWIFVGVASFIIALGWTIAICIFAAGRCLARRTRHTFCVVIAGVECMFMPFGTVLGVFTLIVLMRPSVKELFGRGIE